MEINNLTAPNREYLEFSFVGETATGKGNNQKFVMEACPALGTFKCTEGRIGVRVGAHKPKSWTKPMAEWDNTYSWRLSKGWLLTKQQKMGQKILKSKSSYKPIDDVAVREFIQMLLDAAQQEIDKSYTVRIDDISEEMITLGKSLLSQLAKSEGVSIAAFNNLLKRLYSAIPRRIDNLSLLLAKGESDYGNIVEREQEMLDMILSQLEANTLVDQKQTILETRNLMCRPVNDEEKEYILSLLDSTNRSQYTNAFRVINNNTEKAFDDFCQSKGLSEKSGIKHLFHGSRTSNFWSIAEKGLLLNPEAPITGKMFGYGIYFAPSSQKSMGYTSGRGSCWAHGDSATSILAIYKVATGKPYYIYRDGAPKVDNSLAGISAINCDCLWAEGRDTLGDNSNTYLYHDEVIIYRQEQCTIEYLIEMKS